MYARVATRAKPKANDTISRNITNVNGGYPKRKALDKSAPQLKGLYCAISASGCGNALCIRLSG